MGYTSIKASPVLGRVWITSHLCEGFPFDRNRFNTVHSKWSHCNSLGALRKGKNFFFFFTFTILYWFCHISTWIRHRYTCAPHPEPSSLLPPRTIPLGRPSAPAPSIQYRASNLDWRLVSYMILYMFQCHSPKSSHPLLSHRVQKTVLYMCVSFAVSYTGLLLPSF